MDKAKKVLVLYGGVSTEHEVSIVTALQAMNALKEAGFEVVPGYISKQGGWYLGSTSFFEPTLYRNLNEVKRKGKPFFISTDGDGLVLVKSIGGYRKKLKVDVVFPVFHGRNGEDGSIQGLVQLVNLPMVGCGLIASAVGMDKFLAKQMAKEIGLGVCPDVLVTVDNWKSKLREIKKMKLPVYVKPVGLGSSIGISKVKKWHELENAIKVALAYDQRVLVEQGVEEPTEINISVLGNGPYQVSVTEQPLKIDEILSFEDKYIGGKKGMASAKRLIPAKVNKKIIAQVESKAEEFFRMIGGKGMARIDFMMDKEGRLIFNEINTIPGSLAFYLWEKSGLKFADLVTKLVELAVADWQARQKLVTTFESNILAKFGEGSKGIKS